MSTYGISNYGLNTYGLTNTQEATNQAQKLNVPHFDFPFRFSGGVVSCVEQDSDKDIYNCVAAAALTERGTRFFVPEFGISDPTFETQPLDLTLMQSELASSESRADLTLEQVTEVLESLVTISVGTSDGS